MLLEVEAINKESIKLKQKKKEEEQAAELEMAQYNEYKLKSEQDRIKLAK